MSDHAWYRSERWGPTEQRTFEERLAAARRTGRQQYLAIQAMTLLVQPEQATQRSGLELADRALREDGYRFEADRVHAALGRYYEGQQRFADALAQLRMVHSSAEPGGVEEGESLGIARIITRERFPDLYEEAEDRLDLVLAADRWIMRSVRVDYAVARARLADARGRPDEAAAFALGALWQIAEDQQAPLIARHPDVGRARPSTDLESELWSLVDRGDPEGCDPVVDEYRDALSGDVQWRWPLVRRLRTSPYDARRDAKDARRAVAAPMLAELRAVGADTYDLDDVSPHVLTVEGAPEILVSWLARTDDSAVLARVATALSDRRVRRVATQPLIDVFRDAEMSPHAKACVAAAVGMLARDESFEQISDLLRDARHGSDRAYLFSAIGFSKRTDAVDLCLDLLDDPELDAWALRALGDLKSERATATLRAISEEPMPSGRSDEAQTQRDRVRLAQKGLAKLERARASGKARP